MEFKKTTDETQIQNALCLIEKELIQLLKTGDVKASLEHADKAYTAKQRGALHVWCDQCAKTLNSYGIYRKRKGVFGDHDIEMLWNGTTFKEDVYKYVLQAMTGIESTEDQTTVTPSDVALVISKQYAENGLICPDWPSKRGGK